MLIMSNSDASSKPSYCLAHNENISITTDGVSDNRRAKIADPNWVFEMLASHVAKKKKKKEEQIMYAKWQRMSERKSFLMEHTVCYPQGPPLFLVIKALVRLRDTNILTQSLELAFVL